MSESLMMRSMSLFCSSLDCLLVLSDCSHMSQFCSSQGCSLGWSNKSYSDKGWVEKRNLMISKMRYFNHNLQM